MAFKGKSSKNGNPFRLGCKAGSKVRSSALNKQTNWTGGALFHKRDVAKNRSFGTSTMLEDGERRYDLGLILAIEKMVVRETPEREGPAKRQAPEVEDMWLRKNRVYRKCSRSCHCNPNPRAKQLGCQGFGMFPSCGVKP